MKRNYFFLSLIFVLVFLFTLSSFNVIKIYSISQDTPVGGILSGDITWTLANSPYVLTKDIQIPNGVTLTIHPGVIIKGNNYSIKVWGTLKVTGTSSLKVKFNDTNIVAGNAQNKDESPSVDIQYADIDGGSIYPATEYNFRSSLILRDLLIKNLSAINIVNPIFDCYIERNIFINSGPINVWLYGTLLGLSNSVGRKVFITNNVFLRQNTNTVYYDPSIPYAVENWQDYEYKPPLYTVSTIVQYNSFLTTNAIAVGLKPGTNAAMLADHNYWDTTDVSKIESMIFDKNDDLGCAGYITYMPILDKPDQNTPNVVMTITASAGSGGSISPTGAITVNYGDSKTFTITPNSGYKISNVKVDGGSVGAVSTYTFTNVTSNHSIEVLFEKNQQNIIVKLQIGNKIMIVNGVENQLDAAPEIKNGRTFLPLRAISEAFGAKVVWLQETQGITITLGENNIGLQIGNTSAVVNGAVMSLDAPPYIKNGRTMVPIRIIAEGLGATVEWNPVFRTVTVTITESTTQLPIASFTMNPISGTAPLEVTFDASNSYDPDGNIVSYAWDFGDGTSGSGVTMKHTFNSKGSYNIKLTVTDNKEATSITIKTITITETLTFCQIGVPYIADDGLTVVLNSLTITEKSGSYQYTINYTVTNNTADKAIDEGTFKMYYKNESGGLPQYGFFNKLFPGDTRNRTYTFEELKSKPFDVLEYSSDNFFSPEPLVNSLKWEVHVP